MPPYVPQPNPYMSSMYPAQQRLVQMEQQYPQFTPQYQQQMQMQPQMQQQQQQNFIKGRAVTSFDEAKASMIDLDGSLHIFTDIGNGKIYTKQINLDGTASIHTYTLNDGANEQQSQKEEIKLDSFVKREELNPIVDKINNLDSVLQQMLQPKSPPKQGVNNNE